MSSLNNLILNLICDKRFAGIKLEHDDAFLESSLDNAAKKEILFSVRKIIESGIGRSSYTVHLERFSADNKAFCHIEVCYDPSAEKEHYQIIARSVNSQVMRVLDVCIAGGVVEIQELSEKDVPKEKLSEHYACSVVDAFWNYSMKMCLNVKGDEGKEKVDENDTSEIKQGKGTIVSAGRSILFPF